MRSVCVEIWGLAGSRAGARSVLAVYDCAAAPVSCCARGSRPRGADGGGITRSDGWAKGFACLEERMSGS